MYWPKEGCEIYGVIQVKLVKEDVMATYIVRTFQLRHLKVIGTKTKTCKLNMRNKVLGEKGGILSILIQNGKLN